MKNFLVLDTALNGCSVSVCAGERVISRAEAMSGGQVERLMPMIEEVMAEAGIAYNALEAIVTTVGPGAFTGLRIGLSTAKALGLSLDIPVYGITTTQAMAWAFLENEGMDSPFSILLDTKRTDFYIQHFNNKAEPTSEPQALHAEQIFGTLSSQTRLAGDALGRFARCAASSLFSLDKNLLFANYTLVDTAVLAVYFKNDNIRLGVFTQDLTPVYLRDADVSMSKTVQRKISSE